KDVDIATAVPPETVMALLEAAGLRAIPTGIDHGTVTAISNGKPFEITTLRHDVETFGRHARVAFTDDWEADAARRDFTINALFCDSDGTVFDPVGGLGDLRAGLVRFVGDPAERIEEDILRLLRFFRFYAHYGVPPPDRDALEACRAFAPRLDSLSVERVWSELRRLLLAPDPAGVFDLMKQWEVVDHVLPEAVDRRRLAALTDIERSNELPPNPVRRLAAMLKAGAGGADDLARRLRLSNADSGRLAGLMAPRMELDPAMDGKSRRRALYRLGGETFADIALLGWAASVDGSEGDDSEEWRELWRDAVEWISPDLPVAGGDVLKLGVPRGRDVGRLLASVESWWVEGDFRPGRAACLKRLGELARKDGLGPP
ncbi:MAG: CCA tRNA nucleotidyltransferase, partial [Alphaproteobacteria bacterium]